MNHIPDEKQMEELLERAAPATTGRLEKRLDSAPWTARAINRRRYVSLSTLAVLMVSLIFVATPQGSAFAQDVLLFFTRTESDSYYSRVSDLTFEETTPFHEECGISIHPLCSVEQVRSKVDFEVKELSILPDGMYFEGATGGPISSSLPICIGMQTGWVASSAWASRRQVVPLTSEPGSPPKAPL